MPKKRRRRKRDELLSRFFTVSSVNESLSIHATEPEGLPPTIDSNAYLEVRGTVDEPLRDTTDLRILFFPKDTIEVGTARPASVGSMEVARSGMHGAVFITHREFDRMWAMSLAGQLRHGYLAFTKPHYRTSFIVSISFSREKEE
jgi:hypothetical protein